MQGTAAPARPVDDLVDSAMRVIDLAFESGGQILAPLFSGGHDSLVATHLASQHHRFTGDVHHIDTGIGAAYTRGFVEQVCQANRWNLRVWKSNATYERFVSKLGFPGPGSHQWVYNWIKDRCVGRITKGSKTVLLTGCRSAESTRRMGHVAPVKIGETGKKSGLTKKKNRIWTAPCHDWSKAEQQSYMDEYGLPTNKLKIALGMSGECFCGAFAQPGEIELIRQHAPDVAEKIERLTAIAKDHGTPCVWGTRPKGRIRVRKTGPMCNSCDQKLAACGIEVQE